MAELAYSSKSNAEWDVLAYFHDEGGYALLIDWSAAADVTRRGDAYRTTGTRPTFEGAALAIEQVPPPSLPTADAGTEAPRHRPVARWLLRLARFPMIVGIAAIFVAATALFAFAAVQTWRLVDRLLAPGGLDLAKEDLMLLTIKLVDLVLLATVLNIMAIGLYGLFIDSRLPVPPWLRITDIDALKQKLNGVVVTVLGVVFLEQVIAWDGTRDLLSFGVAVAAVVVALSYFLGIRPAKGRPSDEEHRQPLDPRGRP
jgi:uncharacterized membrane protein YqhA